MADTKQKLLNVVKDLLDNSKQIRNDYEFDTWIEEVYISLKRNFPDEKTLIKHFKSFKDADFDLETDYKKTWFGEEDLKTLQRHLENLVIHIQEIKDVKRPEDKTKTEKSIDLLNHLVDDLNVITESEKFNRWRDRAIDFLLPLTGKKSTYLTIYKMRAGGGDPEWNAQQLERFKAECTSLLKELIRIWEVYGVEEPNSSNPGTTINLHQNQVNNQNQSNHQETNINIEIHQILKQFKDSLTEAEINAIKEVQESDDEPTEKKKRIGAILVDKAFDLGVALASTPEIWHWFADKFK